MYRIKGNSIQEHAKYEPEHSDLEGSTYEWHFSGEEIENSPSRKDGIDFNREIYLQRSYSTFLQDLGMRLRIPQITIATATTLCHRFFRRQSHAKYDRTVIATACMVLSGKAEDTPVSLNEILLKSCEILSRKNRLLQEKKNQKDFCQEQRDRVLNAEIIVLTTLGFDVDVHHPYRLIRTAIMTFGIDEECLTQVAWNFLNDGLRTSLWLQFKPHEIAAGTIFLAAKFRRVKLPLDWWRTFHVSPRHLQEVSDQLLELYEEAYGTTSRRNQPIRSGEGTQVAAKDKCYISADQPNDNVTKISDERAFSTLQLSANRMKSLERQEIKIQCERTGDKIRSGIPLKLMEASDQKASTSAPQVDEVDLSSFQERQADKVHIDKSRAEFETKGRIQSSSDKQFSSVDIREKIAQLKRLKQIGEGRNSKPHVSETGVVIDIDKPGVEFETEGGIQSSSDKQFSSVDISYVNAEKIAQLKRMKLLREGRNSKPHVSETEVRDADALIEFELERGVEEAAKAEKAKQERKKYSSESSYKPRKESSQYGKESAGKDGTRLKRKRSKEDISNKDIISENKRRCSTNEADLCHQGQEMLRADEMEEGEIPNSPLEELTKSSNEGLSQRSSQPDIGKDSINSGDYCDHEPCKNKDDSERFRDRGIRHGSYDRRVLRSHHHAYHSSDHQGRDYSSERKRYSDKNWEEQRDRARERKRYSDRNSEEEIYKRRRRDD